MVKTELLAVLGTPKLGVDSGRRLHEMSPNMKPSFLFYGSVTFMALLNSYTVFYSVFDTRLSQSSSLTAVL